MREGGQGPWGKPEQEHMSRFLQAGGRRSALLASECAHIAAQQERANPRRKDCADQTPAKRVNMSSGAEDQKYMMYMMLQDDSCNKNRGGNHQNDAVDDVLVKIKE